MNWLVLWFAFQLGFTPNDGMVMYTPSPYILYPANEGIIDMDMEFRLFNTVYIGGDVGTLVWKTGGIDFWPNRMTYSVRAGIRHGGIELGWSHYCTHPVLPFQPMFDSRILWEGGYDEFHIKFSGEFHF